MILTELPMTCLTAGVHPKYSYAALNKRIPVVPQPAQLPASARGCVHDVKNKNDPGSASELGQSDFAPGLVGKSKFRCRRSQRQQLAIDPCKQDPMIAKQADSSLKGGRPG